MTQRIISLLLFIVCLTGDLYADTLFSKKLGDSEAMIIVKDCIVLNSTDSNKNDGEIITVSYFYWHLRAKEVRTEWRESEDGEILTVKYSEAAARKILIDRILSKASRARVFDAKGVESEYFAIRVSYGMPHGYNAIYGSFPEDDKLIRLSIKDDAPDERFKLSQLRSVEFINDNNVELVLKDNSSLKGSWDSFGAKGQEWSMTIKGYTASGKPIRCKIEDLIKIEFYLTSK